MSGPITLPESLTGQSVSASAPAETAAAPRRQSIPVERIAEGKQFAASVRCPICKDVLWDAVLCDACLEAFCSHCMDAFVRQTNGLCSCGKPFQKRAINKRIQDMLNALKFSCLHPECKDLLSYQQVPEHDKVCPYEKVQCPNAPCGTSVYRKDLEQHKRKECLQQVEECENCKAQVRRCDREKHDSDCPLKQVVCEYCKSKVVQKYADQHSEVCPMHPVECKTCMARVTRNELPTHNCFATLRKEMQGLKPVPESIEDSKAAAQITDPQKAVLAMKRIADKMDLIVCPECKRLAQRGNLYKCSACNQPMCIGNCLDYCRKCKRTLCKRCRAACLNCFVPLCLPCRKTNDHCYLLHFFNFEMSDGTYIYVYDIKAPQIRRNKIAYPNASQDLLDSVTIDRTIYLCGGRKRKADTFLSNTIGLVLSPDLTVVQKELCNLNQPRCLHRLVGHSLRQFFCIGGTNSKGPLSACETYHIRKNCWTSIASMNESRVCPTVLAAGKLIYALGSTGTHSVAIEEYNVDTNIWTALKVEDPGTWPHRGRGVGIAIEETFLLFEDDGNLYKWGRGESKIVAHSAMKTQSLFVQSKPVVYNNYVYLFDNNEMQNQVVAYSLANQSWRSIPDWGKLCC